MSTFRTSKRPSNNTPCGYCFSEWATGYDHLIPISYKVNNSSKNLYPCCKRCNSILGNKMFNSIQEKRNYVQSILLATNEWKFSIKNIENEQMIPIEPILKEKTITKTQILRNQRQQLKKEKEVNKLLEKARQLILNSR